MRLLGWVSASPRTARLKGSCDLVMDNGELCLRPMLMLASCLVIVEMDSGSTRQVDILTGVGLRKLEGPCRCSAGTVGFLPIDPTLSIGREPMMSGDQAHW